MRKIILFAAFVCFAALSVSAQTEEPESKIEKMLRLTKTANENPTDWKAQLEAGHFLLDKEKGVYNQSQAEKYYERIYHHRRPGHGLPPAGRTSHPGAALLPLAALRQPAHAGALHPRELPTARETEREWYLLLIV